MGIWIGLLALLLSAMPLYVHGGQQDAHLLVLTTDSSGRAVISVAGQHRSNSHTNYPFTNDVQVSPACVAAGRSRRCQKLQILSSGQTHIVLAPLQDAIGLMELRYDGRALLKVRDSTLSITAEFNNNCVPLDIVRFEGRLMVLCLENLRNLKSCDIDVDQTNVSRSALSQCVHLLSFASPIMETDYRYISNFVLFTDQAQILFAVRGDVYHIRIRRQLGGFSYSLNDVSCDHLEYAGNHVFYAYCATGLTKMYYPDLERALPTGPLIPFACPESDQTLSETLFQVQQTDRDTVVRYDGMNYTTTGLNFTTGECYNADTFFLVDSIEGTKAFHQSSGSFDVISNSSRDRDLTLFSGPYVVVYQIDPAEAVLFDPSFQRIVGINETAVAVGVVTGLTMQPHASSGLHTISPTPSVIPTTSLTPTATPTAVSLQIPPSTAPPPIPSSTPTAPSTELSPTPTSPPSATASLIPTVPPTPLSTVSTTIPLIEMPPQRETMDSGRDVAIGVGSGIAVLGVVVLGLLLLTILAVYRSKKQKQRDFLPLVPRSKPPNDPEGVVLTMKDVSGEDLMAPPSDPEGVIMTPMGVSGSEGGDLVAPPSDPEGVVMTPMDASGSEGGALVSANQSFPSSGNFGPEEVAQNYERKTNTDDKRNKMHCKVQEMQRTNN